jgi:uncharacterized protein (TIGR02246 family)
MKRWLWLGLCVASTAVAAAEVTVMRPRGFVADEWHYYIVADGKPLADLLPGERATVQVPPSARALFIHCPKPNGGYDASRIDVDLKASAPAFVALHTTRECVRIEKLDAAGASQYLRQTVVRANRRMEYDPGKVDAAVAAAAAAPALAADTSVRDQVAAATAAWAEAFNRRDTARLAAFYDPEAVLTDADARPRVGNAAIAEYYNSAAKRATRQVALGERSIRVFGDTAIDSGTLTFFEMRDGQPTTTPARYSLTYRNRDGKWLIVDHQSSPAPR